MRLILISLILATIFSNTMGFSKSNKTVSLNVISYNIRMNTQADGVNAWPLRKDKVIGLLNFYKPDIFGIQEGLPEQVEDMKAGLPEFETVGVGRDDGKESGNT